MKSTSGFTKLACISLMFLYGHTYNIDSDNARVFSGPEESQFGYYTLLLKHESTYKLLIAAPNDTNNENLSSGRVYICDVDDNKSCTPFYDKGDASEITKHNISTHYLEGFGSCIIQPTKERVVMCAPRYKDMKFRNHAFVRGRCLSINTDIETDKNTILPVINARKYANGSGYIQGMAESGFSCSSSRTGAYVLGAPGLNTWRGGFAVVDGDNRDDTIIDMPENLFLDRDSYLGYAVSSGNFCGKGKFCFAAAAPRHQHKGVISFYEYIDKQRANKKFDLEYPDEETIGSYFGYSLCSADINGDGWDDLLVGAPFYTLGKTNARIKPNEGRVWVYTSRGNSMTNKATDYFELPPIMLIGSEKEFANFGYTISNLGDINDDKIDDIAVGAPYENGKGAVYVYNGSPEGMITEFSQKLDGAVIAQNLTGFGSHISRPLDVDDNGYPDMVVGSMMSNKAVLLRTRPIIDLVADMSFDQKLIQLDRSDCPNPQDSESCINLTLCFQFAANRSLEIEIVYQINVDTKALFEKRVQVHGDDGGEDSFNGKIITSGNKKCKSLVLVTYKDSRLRDPFTPVVVEARFAMNESRFPAGDIIPIVNKNRPNVITESTSFKIKCGDDNVCEADLKVEGSIVYTTTENFIVVNKTDTVDVEVQLQNLGESSFGSQVVLTWTELPYQRITVRGDCYAPKTESKDRKFICGIFPPVKKGNDVHFTVSLKTKQLSLRERSVNFTLEAFSSSKETDRANNVANLSSLIWIQANPIINGNSFSPEISVKSAENVTFVHRYLIVNDGPSILPVTNLSIHVPYAYKNGDKLVDSLSTVMELENGQFIWCDLAHASQGSNVQPTSSTITSSTKTVSKSTKTASPTTVPKATTSTTATPTTGTTEFNFPDFISSRRKRETNRAAQYTVDNTHRVDCANYKCEVVLCNIPETVQPRGNIVVNVTIKANSEDLPLSEYSVITFFSYVEVLQPNHHLFFPWNEEKKGIVWTPIFKVVPDRVQIWIPIVSVAAALLLLLLLIIILRQCGFFKRKKKTELQKWKRESGYYKRNSSRK